MANNYTNYTNLNNNNNSLSNDSTDYDYSRITIYPSNYVDSNSVNLNYAIPTLNVKINANNNNVNNSYKATKLYVNGSTVHEYNFDDVDYISGDVVGEIILEHTPYNGSGSKLFVIIPVITVNKPNEYNALNSLLNMMSMTGDKSPIEFNLNTNLKSDTGYYYYTHSSNQLSNHFIVFKQAIEVGANSAINSNQNVPNEIDSVDATGTINYVSGQGGQISIYESSSNAKKTDRGTINSLSAKEDQIYIDCQPTGYSEETISTYNLPINSEYTENAANVNLQRTTTSLVVVMVGMLLCYFVGPNVYKTAIIDQLIKNVMYNPNARRNCMNPLPPNSKQDACTNASENERILGGIDSLLLISVFWIFLSLLSVGASYKNSYSTISIYFLFGIISTFFGIQHSRSKKEYMTGKSSDGTSDFTLYEWYFNENWNMDEQFDYNFMGYSVTSIFEALAKLIRNDKTSISFHILLFAGVILVSSLISSGFFELGNPASSKLWGSILIPMFIILYIPFNMSTSGSSIGKINRRFLNMFWLTDTS